MSDQYKPQHPAPWRWAADTDDLLDSAGGVLAGGNAVTPSPLAREMIRLAPEMEALLRELRHTIVEEIADRAVRARFETALKERHYPDLSIIDHESSKHIKEQWTGEERVRAAATGLPAKISALLAAFDATQKAAR